MTMQNDAKFKNEMTSQFKTDIRNLINFDPSTGKSRKFAFYWTAFDQSISCLSLESTEELCLKALSIDTEFDRKLTSASKNDMRNLAIFHLSTKSKNCDFDEIVLAKNLQGSCHDMS